MAISEKIKVIVVGAGYGGMAAAIELTKKGCNVTVFESAEKLTSAGDAILLAPNATRILSRWGTVLEDLEAVSADRNNWTFHDTSGKLLLEQKIPPSNDGLPSLSGPRGHVQNLLHKYAESLGVKFVFGTRISRYFEDDQSAGIYVGDKKYEADAVIAADGVHSKARAYITKQVEQPTPSGFAIFRSILPLSNLLEHPATAEFANIKEDQAFVWIGDDVHCIVSTNIRLNRAGFFITHKDNTRGEESWNRPGKIEDMLAIVEDWDPRIAQVIKSIPPDYIIDFKLIWRDPVTKWISDHGRIALAGDAAHPHLATAGTGGAQAMEDGATLGAVFDRAGKKNIPRALRAYGKLRYERTSLTQRMGWETRRRWHQTDWEAVRSNSSYLKLPQPAWLMGSDAEQYAYDNYDAVVSHLEQGTPFVSTNIPEGYVHKDWTIASLLEKERAGEPTNFWSKMKDETHLNLSLKKKDVYIQRWSRSLPRPHPYYSGCWRQDTNSQAFVL